MVLKQKKA